jgi:chemotaxis protein methyltransferase CheR
VANEDCGQIMQSAWRHADRGMPAEAERDCRKASALDALDPRPYYLLAQLAQERGDPLQAKSLLKKVVYLDPFHIPAYLELGALYAQTDDHPRSRRMYETARAALTKLPPTATIAPYSESSAADILAYVERVLSHPAGASANGAAPIAPLARSA